MTALRWGILSPANIGTAKVIPATQAADRCEVTALASRSEERARAAAGALGIPRAHGSYEALLSDPEVDAVYVPLPNHLHAEWTIAAARAGKHVLCEKPMALSVADAEAMVAACEAEGVLLMEAFMYRLHPSWTSVQELVASGRIGALRAVDVWFSYFNDDPANIRNIAEAGGGALWDIGCYAVNVARLLFGEEPRRVEASITRDPTTGCDVLTAGLLEFDDATATFTCSTRLEPDQRVHVHGTDGRISIGIPFNIPPDRPAEVHLTSGGDPPVSPATDTLRSAPADQYRLQAEAFARAVLDGTPLPTSPQDAVANVRVIERLFAAAERRDDPGDR
jgi:predicted dehydrogenase